MLHTWGHEVAAQWFVIVALANLTNVFDLGMHNAGHSQLLAGLAGDHAAANAFRQTWALTRLTIFGMTALFIMYQCMIGTPFLLLTCIMICSAAIDTTLGARGLWFDTLGHFIRVEGAILVMTILRLSLSITALIIFKAPPIIIAWINLLISISGIVIQRALLRSPLLGFTAGGFADLNWNSLAIIRLVVADPLCNWVRTSLPVIIFAVIAPSAVVTTYVALRAVFGLARQVSWQITRYASVRYIQHMNDDKKWAEQLVVRAIQATVVIGVGVSTVAIVDQGRLIRTWIGFISDDESSIVLSFAFGTIGFGYYVITNVMMRFGEVAGVAKRQYIYLVAALLTAVITRFFHTNATVYLCLLAGQEILIAALFVGALSNYVMRNSVVAFLIGSCVIGLTVFLVHLDAGEMFKVFVPIDLAKSFGVAIATTSLSLIALFVFDKSLSRI
ncbi:unnamed protein product [Sphagnum tenellum]